MDLHQRAGERFLAAGDRGGWARARGGWLIAATHAGRVAEVDLAAMDEARQILTDTGQTFRLVVLEQNIGLAYIYLGFPQEAMKAFDRGLTYTSEHTYTNLRAMLLGNKANVFFWQGDLSFALRFHQEAHASFLAAVNKNSAAIEEIYLSSIARLKWHHREALHHLSSAIHTLQDTKLLTMVAFALNYRAIILLSLNRNEDALQDAQQAVDIIRGLEVPIDLALALRTLALASDRCNLAERALQSLSESEKIMVEAGYAQKAIPIALERIALLLRNGDALQAKAAAFTLLKEPLLHESAPFKSEALLLAAETSLALGEVGHASAMTHALLRRHASSESLDLLYRAHLLLARVNKREGHGEEALQSYQRTIEHLSQHLHELVLDQRAQFLEDKDAVYLEAMETALSCGKIDEAVAFLEASRNFGESRFIVPNSQVNRQIVALRQRHRNVSESLLSMPSQSHLTFAAQQELKRLTSQLRDVLEEHTPPSPLKSLTNQPLFPSAIPMVLMYALLERDVIIFVVQNGHITTERVTNGAQQLRKTERAIRLGIDTLTERLATVPPQQLPSELSQWGASLRMNLGRLWSLLVQPVVHLLPPDDAPLAFIPHGILHAVPLLAMHDGERYVAERWRAHILPSRRVFSPPERTATHASIPLLALGYSHEETLPQAREEAQRIAHIMGGTAWVGTEARGERLLAGAGAPLHLHIAAHGALRFDVPNASFVQLADGPFHPTDVVEMDLRGCRLVTLSACETGLGRMSGGDEQIGLVRAFGIAGAEAVLATLWRVDDASTFAFMTCLYQHIARGAPPATALRLAQCHFIDGGEGALRQHPYFWAGFQLTTNAWYTEAESVVDVKAISASGNPKS
ncbi:MAG: CHAT domain-containing protein [Ktedonobacterales bacterium]|nr:CHAT domain-containing protein [Ktedonobacterales bacterium]